MNPFPELFVIDLDGTALGGGYLPYARLPDPFSVLLDGLAAKGCRWAVNTTWDVNGQWQLIQGSSVKSRPSFLIAEFGLRVANLGEDGPEYVQPYTSEMERKLIPVQQEALLPLLHALLDRFSPTKVQYYGHLLSFTVADDASDELARYVRDLDVGNGSLTHSLRNGTLSCTPAMLNKGLGLAEVLRLTGIQADRVLIAGDGAADIAMMQPGLAGCAVCPENAESEVKEHVLSLGGEIGKGPGSRGTIDAFAKLAKKHQWDAE